MTTPDKTTRLWRGGAALLATLSLGFTACTQTPPPAAVAAPQVAAPVAAPAAPPVPEYGYTVVHSWHHDPQAFTQGLIIEKGVLYESTGLEGRSSLRRVDLETGKVLKKVEVPSRYFAEGMTLFEGKIFQLTWQAQKGFIYDPQTFRKTGEFAYTGEGWGLTHDDKYLILSDGTADIRFLDPHTFKVVRTIHVVRDGYPLVELNELEYIKGEIWANIWQTDTIARINPQTGAVVGLVDLTGLRPAPENNEPIDVLNGIAYDAAHDRLFVTGKLWPRLFEIRFKPKQ